MRPDVASIIRSYYDEVDAGRLDAALLYFTEDATLRIANGDQAVGREAIAVAVGGVLTGVQAISHDITTVLDSSYPDVAYEAMATYTLDNGSEVSLPGAVLCRFEEEQFSDQRLYIDFSPIAAAGGVPATDQTEEQTT